MKFIHISDLHLGIEPEKGRPWAAARKNEIWKTFDRIIDECNNREIDLLLISGDLFNKQPGVKDLKTVNESFEKLKKTKVVMVAGANDYMSPRSHYRNFKWNGNVTMFSTGELSEAYFYGCGVTVYGISPDSNDTDPVSRIDPVPKKSAGAHILLCHTMNLSGTDFDKLDRAGFEYVALGGEHQARKVTDRVVFSGSPEPLNREETGDHGFILGELVQSGEKYSLQTSLIPVARRSYVDLHIRISADDTNSAIKELVTSEILSRGPENLYRVFVDGLRDPEFTLDKQAIMSIGVITDVIDGTVLDYNYDELMTENSANLIGAYINAIKDSDAPESVKNRALYYGVEALLKAGGK